MPQMQLIISLKRVYRSGMSIDELKAISPVFEEDVFDAISMETCVSTRCTVGAPSKTSMDKAIAVYDEYMKSNWQDEV